MAKKAARKSSSRRSSPKRSSARKVNPVTVPVKSKSDKESMDKALAIVGLLVNVLLFPGLGTVIAGRTRTGIWQIVLLAIGLILSLILIGIPIVIAVWIWALITSIKILQERL